MGWDLNWGLNTTTGFHLGTGAYSISVQADGLEYSSSGWPNGVGNIRVQVSYNLISVRSEIDFVTGYKAVALGVQLKIPFSKHNAFNEVNPFAGIGLSTDGLIASGSVSVRSGPLSMDGSPLPTKNGYVSGLRGSGSTVLASWDDLLNSYQADGKPGFLPAGVNPENTSAGELVRAMRDAGLPNGLDRDYPIDMINGGYRLDGYSYYGGQGYLPNPSSTPAPHTIAEARAQEREFANSQKPYDENYYNAPVGGPNSGSSDGGYSGNKSSGTPAPDTIADARAQERDYANSQGHKRPTADPKDISKSVLDDIHSKSGKIWSEKSGSGAGGRDEGNRPGPGQRLSKDTKPKDTKSKETKSKDTKSDNDPGKKGPRPVVLDLDGNGFDISTLGTSSTFVAMDETGLLTRTAWARGNDGVLVIDANGDGKISSSKEFVFTEWAPSRAMRIRYRFDKNARARTDFQALKRCSGF